MHLLRILTYTLTLTSTHIHAHLHPPILTHIHTHAHIHALTTHTARTRDNGGRPFVEIVLWAYGLPLAAIVLFTARTRRHLARLVYGAWRRTCVDVCRTGAGSHAAIVQLMEPALPEGKTDVGGSTVLEGNSILAVVPRAGVDMLASRRYLRVFVEDSTTCASSVGAHTLLDQLAASGDTGETVADILAPGRSQDLLVDDGRMAVETQAAATTQFLAELATPAGTSHCLNSIAEHIGSPFLFNSSHLIYVRCPSKLYRTLFARTRRGRRCHSVGG